MSQPPPAAPPGGVHHIALQVRDLAACERFYCDVLGLVVLRRWPRPDGLGERAIWLDLGGAFLAIEVVEGEASSVVMDGRPGWFLVAVRIEARARAALRRHLAQSGFPVEKHSPYTLYTRDPEGNRVGLSHFPDPAPDDADDHL